jgi:hypothetical protein
MIISLANLLLIDTYTVANLVARGLRGLGTEDVERLANGCKVRLDRKRLFWY